MVMACLELFSKEIVYVSIVLVMVMTQGSSGKDVERVQLPCQQMNRKQEVTISNLFYRD